MENTKDIILYQALTLFSDRGYEGVSMRDIASKVGIKLHLYIITITVRKIYLIALLKKCRDVMRI